MACPVRVVFRWRPRGLARTARAALSLTRGKRKRDERRLRLPSFARGAWSPS